MNGYKIYLNFHYNIQQKLFNLYAYSESQSKQERASHKFLHFFYNVSWRGYTNSFEVVNHHSDKESTFGIPLNSFVRCFLWQTLPDSLCFSIIWEDSHASSVSLQIVLQMWWLDQKSQLLIILIFPVCPINL